MLDHLMTALLLLAVLISCLAAWRFATQRSRGTQVIARRLPAKGAHGWRHGVIRYRGETLQFFKLRSLSPSPDFAISRRELSLSGRREQTAAEQRFMEPNRRILLLKGGDIEWEWAMDTHGEMALLAWLESAPTRPIIRTDPREAMKYFMRNKRN